MIVFMNDDIKGIGKIDDILELAGAGRIGATQQLKNFLSGCTGYQISIHFVFSCSMVDPRDPDFRMIISDTDFLIQVPLHYFMDTVVITGLTPEKEKLWNTR